LSLALINEEPIPISDEKYAEELHLQEALYSSSSNPSTQENPLFKIPKTEDVLYSFSSLPSIHENFLFKIPKTEDEEQSILENRERGESSETKLVFCGICMDYKPKTEIFNGLNICNHKFCTDCIIKYVASKIRENHEMVNCPDPKCNQAIEPENCSAILPKEVFVRWENVLFEVMIPGGQKFYCPYKNCSVLMVDDGGVEVRESECPSCRRLFCARCQVPWHDGLSCEEFLELGKDEREREDIMVMKLAKDKSWKRCPNCKIFVERSDGCVHMTCRCHYEFCYQCGDKWSSTHVHA
ncbi:probable E3 ubiquitin-protein ligase RNF217, partial [Chenopodium quinoa]|uniref:probable E3 ubiquitin-protein ligase RNF217 n=1 Tax=Chenopodium quinoa TaxID=63459 RepID=UPI000B773A69